MRRSSREASRLAGSINWYLFIVCGARNTIITQLYAASKIFNKSTSQTLERKAAMKKLILRAYMIDDLLKVQERELRDFPTIDN